MARVATPEVSSTTMQTMNDAGINPFAVQMLVESYASPQRVAALNGNLKPLDFVWRGVRVQLSQYEGPLVGTAVSQPEGGA